MKNPIPKPIAIRATRRVMTAVRPDAAVAIDS